EQADVGRHRSDGREPREIRFDRVDLALVRGAHRAARRIQRNPRRAALTPMLRILAKARGKYVLEPAAESCLRRALEQLGQIAALPEFVLECIGLARRAFQLEQLE